MSLLMRDPRKLAALVLQGNGVLKKAPESPRGGTKDYSAVIKDRARSVMNALKNEDADSLVLSLQGIFDALKQQSTDQSNEPVQVNNEANSGNPNQSNNTSTPEV